MKSVERLTLISIDFTSDCQPAVGCFAVNCDTLFKTFSFKGRSQYHELFTQSEEVSSFFGITVSLSSIVLLISGKIASLSNIT